MKQKDITTKRLRLRRLKATDLEGWDQFFLSDRAQYVGGGSESGDALSWRVFSSLLGHWDLRGTGPFAIEKLQDAQVIGMAGPWYPRGWPERELTWSLWGADYEGFGYATEAVKALRRHVTSDLGWDRIVSYVDPANDASIKLCRKLGCSEDPAIALPDDDPTLAFVHPIGSSDDQAVSN
ncbi:GNAT family N-acetyltransferase [Rhodophyticola porphyridii]|uniref:GNAT family N-acetyltransferase n=1 Tax=Rhodophyticola porphyridii TaxID=1852017 RepID=UPI0035D0A397